MSATRGAPERATILVVDDRDEDLMTLDELLAAPDREIVRARSGREALRLLLGREFALILLDVVMPEMDGFEVATLIRQRVRLRHTPIVFLTGQDDDARLHHAYSLGAIDYLAKPVDPHILRAKVSVFVALHHKDQQLRAQAAALREADRRERQLQIAEIQLANQRRHYNLTEALPHLVFSATANGAVSHCNRRWTEFTGLSQAQLLGWGWLGALEPTDREVTERSWQAHLVEGGVYETQLRIRTTQGGTFRWHLFRAVPEIDADGRVAGWLATATDFHDQKVAQDESEEARRHAALLADASELLAAASEVDTALGEVAQLAMARLPEINVVAIALRSDAEPRVVVAHAGEAADRELLEQLGEGAFVARVNETKQAELVADGTVTALGLRSVAAAPLIARDRTLGAIMLASRSRLFGRRQLEMTVDLAHRCALAIDNKDLLREAEEAVRARDDFLSVASHELRTPLTPLLLQVQGMRRVVAPSSAPGTADLTSRLEVAERQTRRLMQLIDRLLDISRISSGKLALESRAHRPGRRCA